MSSWSDVIAIQQRNALDAAANAQMALANETARHNQIVQQVENQRNELLQRQLDEQKRADKQERFAKGLLVQAEFDIQSADISEMEYDDLSAHIGNLNSLIDFADNNRLLSDFFLNIDDIRFAQKTIRDVKSHLELANGFFTKAREELEKEKLRAQLESMKENLGPYIKKSDELRDAAPPDNNPEETELFYSQQTYLHTVYLDWIRVTLGSFETQFPGISSEFETTLKQIESDIKKSTSHLSTDGSEEIQAIVGGKTDFSTLVDTTNWQQFDPEHTESHGIDHICPVCDGIVNLAKLPGVSRERSKFIVYCGFRKPISGPYQLHSVKSDTSNHYCIITSNYDAIRQILDSKSSALESKLETLGPKHADDLAKIEKEEENASGFFNKRNLRKRENDIKREYETRTQSIAHSLELNGKTSEILRKTIKSERKKSKKSFRIYTQAYTNQLMRCFGYVPEDQIDLVKLIKTRRQRIQQLTNPDMWPMS